MIVGMVIAIPGTVIAIPGMVIAIPGTVIAMPRKRPSLKLFFLSFLFLALHRLAHQAAYGLHLLRL